MTASLARGRGADTVSRHMPQTVADRSSWMSSPPLVALAGWLIPGAGYWLIGQRTRAVTVGITILSLFVGGILIGGIRAIQVPGYGENGGRLYLVGREVKEHRAGRPQPSGPWIATDFRTLLADVGNKPWSICQVLTGPLGFLGGAGSVWASRPREANDPDSAPGVLSHARINEIGVLYTAVAGMLNLLAIIDAAARAGRPDGGFATEPSPAAPSSSSATGAPEAA
jgi:hypothetical protein